MRTSGMLLLPLLACGACDAAKSLADLDPVDPDTAPHVVVDRFSDAAATLHVRTPTNGLPAAGDPVDFDALFTGQGLGPDGQVAVYYDFDAQPREPALIYKLYYEGSSDAVPDQLPLVDVVPGDAGYSDFWWVNRVFVPRDYAPNSITDVRQIAEFALATELTEELENCPMVPEGSTAALRLGSGEPAQPFRAWYRGQIAHLFFFREAPLRVTQDDLVPISTVWVTFNVNGDPSSGIMTEADGVQRHNVLASIPPDPDYSPLWEVDVYDNAYFDSVIDEASALMAPILIDNMALVNCPVVATGP